MVSTVVSFRGAKGFRPRESQNAQSQSPSLPRLGVGANGCAGILELLPLACGFKGTPRETPKPFGGPPKERHTHIGVNLSWEHGGHHFGVCPPRIEWSEVFDPSHRSWLRKPSQRRGTS